MARMFIASRLPMGLMLPLGGAYGPTVKYRDLNGQEFDGRAREDVEIRGMNGDEESRQRGFAVTEVDGEAWGQFQRTHADMAALASGALTPAANPNAAAEAAKEMKGEPTGMDPLTESDAKASGVEKVDGKK